MNWSPDQITFMIDDVPYYTYNPTAKNSDTWPFDLDQFLLLNIAMGGFSGTPDAGFTESSMLIDYVRVYQNTSLSVADEFIDTFSVSPNPTADFIEIKTNENIDTVAIYSTLGQLVLHRDNPTNQVNITTLKTGLYKKP